LASGRKVRVPDTNTREYSDSLRRYHYSPHKHCLYLHKEVSRTGTLRAVAVAPTGTAYVAGDGSLGQVGYCGSTGCGFIPVGKNPFGIAITSDGSGAYVTNHDDDTVSVINTALNITVGTPIFLGSG
jgi:DNA-binding beta-propeller fold protein YncE